MRLVGNAASLATKRAIHGVYVDTRVRAAAAATTAGRESGANKEERGVLAAINRHRPTIIIDTRCPRNESIYTAVYRYVILSGLSSP